MIERQARSHGIVLKIFNVLSSLIHCDVVTRKSAELVPPTSVRLFHQIGREKHLITPLHAPPSDRSIIHRPHPCATRPPRIQTTALLNRHLTRLPTVTVALPPIHLYKKPKPIMTLSSNVSTAPPSPRLPTLPPHPLSLPF